LISCVNGSQFLKQSAIGLLRERVWHSVELRWEGFNPTLQVQVRELVAQAFVSGALLQLDLFAQPSLAGKWDSISN
jgi:hypothetical protein